MTVAGSTGKNILSLAALCLVMGLLLFGTATAQTGGTSTEGDTPDDTAVTVIQDPVSPAETGSMDQAIPVPVEKKCLRPIADFQASPQSGVAPLAVRFTDTSSGTITSIRWDFNGDGITDSTKKNPFFTYKKPGSYTVKLTVTGPGGSDTKTKKGYITVSSLSSPAAGFSAEPTEGYAPLTVQFADKSQGTVSSYAWDFSDGNTSAAQNPLHTYSDAGDYTVTLTVTGPGGSNSTTKTGYIHVSSLPPLPNYSILPTDPDNDSLFEDLNGNNRKDMGDVVLYFENKDWIAANEPISAFDFNGNGRIDLGDVVILFEEMV